MSGSCQAGTRWMNTGASGMRSSAASSGNLSSAAYASSTKRHVVSIPFQSTRSLKAARPFRRIEATKRVNHAHPVPQGESMRLARAPFRELQDGLALADVPQILTSELLDVRGIAAQPVDRLRQLLRTRPQGDEVALEAFHLALHVGDAHDRADAIHRERAHHDQQRGTADEAAVHRAVREYRLRPGHDAAWPSSSSIRSSWLYFAVRSLRASDPVLIWPAFTATARSATNVSSVSPERCEITVPYPARLASSMASSVSVSVPTWFTFTSTALAR